MLAGESSGRLLFAGCYGCVRDLDGHYATIIRSTNGGSSWESVTTPANLDYHVVGSGERWIMADGKPGYMLGAFDAVASQLVVQPSRDGESDDTIVLMAGRGGLWRSTDAGDTWSPAVTGLSESNSKGLAIDPADSNRIFQGAAHFGLQASSDAFQTAHMDALSSIPLLGRHRRPTAIRTAFDTSTTPSTVLIAGGDSQETKVGGIFQSRDPWSGDPWTDLCFTDAFPDKQPTSLAVGYDPDGARVVIAAAHPRGGVVFKVDDLPWERSDGEAMTKKSPPQSDLLWLAGSPLVYLFDLGQGIFRSDDGGRSFALIWGHPSEAHGSGAIAAAADDPGTLYVAAHDGLYRLTGADSGSLEGVIAAR